MNNKFGDPGDDSYIYGIGIKVKQINKGYDRQ